MEEIQIFRFAVLQVKRNRKESCIFIPYCLETCVCCYRAGDTASMLSKSDAVALTQLTAMLYVLLFTCLPICDTCFGQICFTKGPSYVTAWLGRISVFLNTVWACGVRSHIIHQLCAAFSLCNSLPPSLIQDHSSRLEGALEVLWSNLLLEQGQLQCCSGLVQETFEFLQGWRFHSLSG